MGLFPGQKQLPLAVDEAADGLEDLHLRTLRRGQGLLKLPAQNTAADLDRSVAGGGQGQHRLGAQLATMLMRLDSMSK